MTNRPWIAAGLLCLAAACGDRPAAESTDNANPPASPSAAPPAAAAPADPAEFARQRIAAVDSLAKNQPGQTKMFARVPGQAELVVVRDTASWPEEVEMSINLWTDATGRPLALSEGPFSESGDWFADFTHYFDEQGRTVAYRNQSAWFVSGCTEIMRMDERRLYRPGLALIRADTTFTDGDDKPLASTQECMVLDLAGDHGVTVAGDYDALVQAGRAPRLGGGN